MSWQPACWDCLETVPVTTGSCCFCGAELRGGAASSPGARAPRVTRRWHAASGAELRPFAGWVHDADWDQQELTFDGAAATVTLPFWQQPTTVEECGLAAPWLVARSADGSERHDLPFVRCTLTIGSALSLRLSDDGLDAPRQMSDVTVEDDGRTVEIFPVEGPTVWVTVDAVDVTIEMTDRLWCFHNRSEAAADTPALWMPDRGWWW